MAGDRQIRREYGFGMLEFDFFSRRIVFSILKIENIINIFVINIDQYHDQYQDQYYNQYQDQY